MPPGAGGIQRSTACVINTMLPYLSHFLGHKGFRDTFYYYHYVEETARTIRKKDTVTSRVIPEVMRR